MIKNIQIENYKSIRSLDMDMKPINILIGSNGSGKSNFISFFRFLKNICSRNLQNHIAEEGSCEDFLHFGSKVSDHVRGKIEFNNDEIIVNGSNSINFAYEFILKPNADSKLFFQDEYAIEIISDEDGICPIKEKISFGSQMESSLPYFQSSIGTIVLALMESYRVYHFHDTGKTSKLRKPAQLNDNEFLRMDGSNLPAFLYWMQEKHPKEFKKTEMIFRSVAPFFGSFHLRPDKLKEDQIHLRWKEKNPEVYFGAQHLSDGSLRFLSLVTLLLQPEAPPVIIIDEPELGLHPFAINKLAGLIKMASSRTQIIISTQSTELVDNFDPEDIVTIDRKDNQSIFKRLARTELCEWINDYTISELWNKNVVGGRP